MIGNDLIHLPTSCLRNKLNDHRFLNKAFTPEEKEQVTSEIDVWRMWAAKEAAYKIVNRKTKIRIFSPKSFVVDINLLTAHHNEESCFFKDEYKDDYLHTVAFQNRDAFESIELQTDFSINSTSQVKKELDNISHSTFGFIIEKDELGFPFYNLKGEKFPISISHDKNRLVAVFLIN